MTVLFTLLAFAAVMVIFSTIVTVAVEGLNKALAFRRSGMKQILRALHVQAIEPRLAKLQGADLEPLSPKTRKISAEAKQFAKDAQENHAFGGNSHFWAHVPLIGVFFQRRFERMTTLQFAEQLARTEPGRQLAKLPPNQLSSALSAISYEFERFGDAHGDYFARRAKVLCVVVGVTVAASLNIDALTLFRSLYSDPQRTQGLLAQIDPAQLNALVSTAQTATRQFADDPNATADQRTQALSADIQTLQTTVNQLSTTTNALTQSGLAFGASIYPYCSPPPGSKQIDARCKRVSLTPAMADCVGEACAEITPEAALPITAAGREILVRRLESDPGTAATWLLSVLVTGGMLGLGAPFWFNLFRRLASMAPGSKLAQLVRSDVADPAQAAAAAPKRQALRDEGADGTEALVRAFRIASGENDGAVVDVVAVPTNVTMEATGAPPVVTPVRAPMAAPLPSAAEIAAASTTPPFETMAPITAPKLAELDPGDDWGAVGPGAMAEIAAQRNGAATFNS